MHLDGVGEGFGALDGGVGQLGAFGEEFLVEAGEAGREVVFERGG